MALPAIQSKIRARLKIVMPAVCSVTPCPTARYVPKGKTGKLWLVARRIHKDVSASGKTPSESGFQRLSRRSANPVYVYRRGYDWDITKVRGKSGRRGATFYSSGELASGSDDRNSTSCLRSSTMAWEPPWSNSPSSRRRASPRTSRWCSFGPNPQSISFSHRR